jgi:hypothetical protein
MSWAGGWFFLMAVVIFTGGQRDFQLPGLGAYLQEAANQGDRAAIGGGGGLLCGLYRAGKMLLQVSAAQWIDIGVSVGATFLCVLVALILALAWTIPLGVLIGTS